MAKTKEKKVWVFTRSRKESLKKARKEHSNLVKIGKTIRDRRK